MARNFKISDFLDKLVLLVAMVIFAWVGISSIIEIRELDNVSGRGRALLSEQKVNAQRYEAEVPVFADLSWRPASSQSRGEDWVFDVFTPPVIYYDPNSREFAVTPPSREIINTVDSGWMTFDLELLEVRLKPYKLQLVGYAGERGSYVAYFENTATGEIVLLRVGQESRELGVKLVEFEERQIRTQNEVEDTPVLQSVGVAKLADYSSGLEVSLTNLETKMFSDLEAKVRLLPAGVIRFVQVGSRLELESGDYVIEDLSANPQEAMITKISKDGDRRFSRTIKPQGELDPGSRGSRQDEAPISPFAITPRSKSSKPQG